MTIFVIPAILRQKEDDIKRLESISKVAAVGSKGAAV